jgi:two-component system, cell cycle response regulator
MSDSPDHASPPRILLAEDSEVIRAMVRQVLQSAGYVVLEAANGQLAFELCRRIRPDIALLDVEMPVLSGPQLLKRLKADPDFSEIPVIFLTSRTSTAEIVEGLRLGAHDYLRKPFEPAELIARVSAAIRVTNLQQQLSRQNAELELLSRTDQLTGLNNRRSGEERLRAEIETARRHQLPLTVLMLDVDHFKLVNDTYGHGGGDVVLRTLAQRIQSILRISDIAARWGGEEFLITLPNTSLEGGLVLGQRIISVIRDSPMVLDDQRSCPVTVSVGAAETSGESIEDLLRQADEALYSAKREGRNRLHPATT